MPGQRADGEVVAVVAHVRQVAQATHVDEDGGRRETELHQWEQRHAAREELRVFAVLDDQRDCFVRRVRACVVEGGRDHRVLCICSAAASTDFTMLW